MKKTILLTMLAVYAQSHFWLTPPIPKSTAFTYQEPACQ